MKTTPANANHFPVVLGFVLGLAGCPFGELPDEQVAVAEAGEAVVSTFDLVGVSDSFFAGHAGPNANLDQVLVGVSLAIRGSVALGEQECLQVETTREPSRATVDVRFNNCLLRGRFLKLDGSLHSDIEIETVSCPQGTCREAVIYRVRTDHLRLSTRWERWWAESTGAWSLRDPVADGELSHWQGMFALTTSRGLNLAMESNVGWSAAYGADDRQCVTLGWIDTVVTVDRPQGPRTISIGAEDVSRCANECPTTGTVQISFGSGQTVDWTYNGSNNVEVNRPLQAPLRVALACGSDDDDV